MAPVPGSAVPSRPHPAEDETTTPSRRLEEILSDSVRIEELSDDSDYEDIMSEPSSVTQAPPQPSQRPQPSSPQPGLVTHFANLNLFESPFHDTLETETSKLQNETLEAVMPFLKGNPNQFDLNGYGLPTLQRPKHVKFLRAALNTYPAPFQMMDAARPWLLYWSLQGLTALGENVDEFRERVVYTFSACQHPQGGFGGGHGQLAHLAASYAAVLSLVIVGGPEAYESIDRKSMWHYLGRMKQRDGGFTVAENGEEDIRGAFCTLVILSLLNLPLELPPDAPVRAAGMTSFLDGLTDWISACQTYEGGISASPGNEAHGAYAFCGLGALAIIGPPSETLPKCLDMSRLIHWLSSRHCFPEGGYNGRTNKLVDGCYSHWIGSCWAIVEAALGPQTTHLPRKGLWDRTALARYILGCCQFKNGGLVDKPSKRPDAYHTCYNLAGLSALQNHYYYADSADHDDAHGGNEGSSDTEWVTVETLAAPFRWKVRDASEVEKWDENRIWEKKDRVNVVHPVFIVPWGMAEKCRAYCEDKVRL